MSHNTRKRKGPRTKLTLDPLKIAFSQDSIKFKFCNGALLSQVIVKLVRGTLKVQDFPPIRVFHYNNNWWSLDNRRLYVFKEAAKKGAFYQIPVIDTSQSEVRRWEIDAKLTTLNAGREVSIRGTALRANKISKCHYCLKECRTPGALSLHNQEKHLEMYREEVKAEEQTIDQFLLSKHFPTRDDIMITLDNLKTNNSLTLNTETSGLLSTKFGMLSLVKERAYDVKSSNWEIQITGKGEKEKDKRVAVQHRGDSENVHWQDFTDLTPNEIYTTNLVIQVLHFKDDRYPFL